MRERVLAAIVLLIGVAVSGLGVMRHHGRPAGDAAGRHRAQPAARPAVVRGRVDGYGIVSGLATVPGSGSPRVALRSFSAGGRAYLAVVDPDTLLTSLVDAGDARVESIDTPDRLRWLAGTAYGRALADGRQREDSLTDAGVTHLRPGQPGINLTVDLCPSARPLDRNLFTTLLNQLDRVERPVPVAIAVTGVWMREHPADLDWLIDLDRTGRLAITWVNHSFHHHTSRTRPLAENFLLEPGTNLQDEVLATERALIERGLVPSIFFRFPGLVSSRELVETVVSYGLIPVGSDAWLGKGEWPSNGSIVLVHGNGNEPLGVKRFESLLARQAPAVREHRWLLLDLRASLIDTERASAR